MTQIDELLIRIKGDVSELEDALGDADEEMSSFGSKMADIGSAVGKGLAIAATATAALGAASIAAASDFETAFVSVRQDVNGTDAEIADLERSLRDMGAAGPVAASELAGVSARLGEVAGIGAAEMPFATDAVVKFSQATGTELGAATEVMAQFVRTTGLAPDLLDNLGSAAIVLSSQFKAPEADLLAFAERLGPVGKALDIGTQELLGFGAVFVGAGVDAGRGANAVKDVLLDMSAAIKDTSEEGQARLKAFAATAGMSADDFTEAFGVNAEGTFAQFLAGLQQAQRSGQPVADILANMGIEGGASADALLRVAGSSLDAAGALAAANKAFEENTALQEEAGKATATFGAMLATMKNKVMEIGITIGQSLMPAVESVVGSLGPLLESLGPVVQDLAGVIADGLADLLPAVQPLLEALVDLIKNLVPPLKALLGPIIEVAKTLAVNLAPIVQALTPTITSLANTLAEVLGPVLGFVNDLLAALLPVVADILLALQPLIEVVLDLVLVALGPLLDLLGPLLEALSPLFPVIAEVVGILAAGLVPIVKILQPILEAQGAFLKAVLTPLFQGLGIVLQFIVGVIRDELSVEFQALGAAADFIKKAWDPLLGFFEGLWTGVQVAFTVAADVIEAAWAGMVGGIRGAINLLISGLNVLISGLNSVVDGINSIVESAADLGGLIDIGDVPNIPRIPSIPHLDVGGEVLRDGLAVLHQGELVVPAAQVRTPFDTASNGGGQTLTLIFQQGSIQVPVQDVGSDFDPERTGTALMEAMQRTARSVAAP